MIPLKRLTQVRDQPELLSCLVDGLQSILKGVETDKPVIEIIPTTNAFINNEFNHMHPHPELILSCVGQGDLKVIGNSYPVKPNKLIVTPRGVAHREFHRHDNKAYANIMIGCSHNRMSSHVRISHSRTQKNIIRNRIAIHDSRMSRVYRYFDDSCIAHGDTPHQPNQISKGLCMAACATLLEVVKSAMSENSARDNDQEHLITIARSYIEQHLSKPDLRISDIAKNIGCNPDYLSHRFHQLSGQQLNHWITEQRLTFACTLLRDSNLGIEQIGYAVGYSDPGYFSRCFRQAYGVSPRMWRKSL